MSRLRAFASSVMETGSGWTDELTCLTKRGRTLAAEISASAFEFRGRTQVADVADLAKAVLPSGAAVVGRWCTPRSAIVRVDLSRLALRGDTQDAVLAALLDMDPQLAELAQVWKLQA